MLAIVAALVAIVAAATLMSLAGIDVDVAVTGLFYDPRTGDFVAGQHSPFAVLRDHGLVAVVSCAALAALAMGRPSRWRLATPPGRAAIFLTLSLALGPGLLVNVILKDNWGRPRPGMITTFGGKHTYVDWWNMRGTCPANCSFVSGEAAAAAWMFAPAMLTPPHWRAAAMAGAAAFTLSMGLLRLAAGGHFLTDIVFGVLIALAVLLAIYPVVFRWPWSAFVSRRQPADPGVSPFA